MNQAENEELSNDNLQSQLLKRLEEIALTEQQILTDLTTAREENQQAVYKLTESERETTDYKVKQEISEKRRALWHEMKLQDTQIMNQKNLVNCIANLGGLDTFTDKKGTEHSRVPVYTKIPATLIDFDEETILTEPKPAYVPFINEESFATKGYVFDAVRIGRDEYLLSTDSYIEPDAEKPDSWMETKAARAEKKPDPFKFVIVTLDQLVLINQYYYVKAKAKAKQAAEERSARNEKHYDSLPEERRAKFFNQPGYYRVLPAAVKKKVTQTEWEALTLAGKEALYKPFKKVGAKRLTSKLEEDSMWRSLHLMYNRFINPQAKSPKPGIAHEEAFAYWRWFRDMMKWKIKDIAVQREALSDLRKIALETSFGDSNTSSELVAEYGILVKRQNGDPINSVEIEQIRAAWVQIQSLFGNLKQQAATDALKISHSGQKLIFASKAIGMFIPAMRTIAVSEKYGAEQFTNTFAHEAAHYIDYTLGQKFGKRWLTDDYEGIAGKLAFAFRQNMNAKSDSDYINATKECFARAMQQYFALTIYGDHAQVTDYDSRERGLTKYILEDKFVSLAVFNEKIKPLVLQFIQENAGFFGEAIVPIELPKNDPAPEFPIEERPIPETVSEMDKLIDELETAMKDMVDSNDPRVRKMNDLIGTVIDKRNELIEKQKNETIQTDAMKTDAIPKKISQQEAIEIVKQNNPQEFEKFGEFDYEIATQESTIITSINGQQETKNTANPGDYILTGPAGEKYIIKPETFKKRYLDLGNGRAKAQGKCYGNIYTGDTISFMAIWNEEMICNSGDYLVSPDKEFSEAYRIEKSVFEKTYRPTKNIKYENIKSCLLSDADNANDYLVEGTEIINVEGGAKESWNIVEFTREGIILKHIQKSPLNEDKGLKTLTFEQFRDMFRGNLIQVAGINEGDLRTINLCIKSIEKCIDYLDLKAYADDVAGRLKQLEYQRKYENLVIETSAGPIDLRWDREAAQHKPKFSSLTKEDHLKLAAAHRAVDHGYDASLMGLHSGSAAWHEDQGREVASNIAEIESQIELLKETLPLLKGKSKKEVKENIELLTETLELLKSA